MNKATDEKVRIIIVAIGCIFLQVVLSAGWISFFTVISTTLVIMSGTRNYTLVNIISIAILLTVELGIVFSMYLLAKMLTKGYRYPALIVLIAGLVMVVLLLLVGYNIIPLSIFLAK